MNINFDQLLPLIERFGLGAAGLWFLFVYIKSIGDKVDKLTDKSNQVYGLLLAMSDKEDRPKGGGEV